MLNPKQLFTPAKDGYSLTTLMNNCSQNQNTLFLIKTDKNEVIGGFVESSLKFNNKGYYGTGSTILFQIQPKELLYDASGTNQLYFTVQENVGIIFGGGNEGPALIISHNLLKGQTNRSETFKNNPLSVSTEFQICSLEVYTI